MKVLRYTAINKVSKVSKGTLPLSDQPHIEDVLEAKKLRLIDYQVINEAAPKPLSYAKLLVFFQALKCYLSAGVMVSEAVDALCSSSDDTHSIKVFLNISHQLKSGKLLSFAIKPFMPKGDMVSLSLLSMAEATGDYANVLEDIEKYIQWQIESKHKILQAMRYPWIVLGVMWAALFGLLYLFTPQLSSYLDQTQAEIPMLTQGLLNLSPWVVQWPEVWLLVPIGGFVVFKFFPKLSLLIQSIGLKIPAVREVVLEYFYSVYSRALALQLKHGYTLVESLQGIIRANEESRWNSEVEKVLRHVSSGVSLTEALRQYSKKYVPRLVLQLVQVGEQSDKLQENLAQLATHYTQSFQRRTDGMIKLIEPLLLLVVGGVMAVFIIGLFYPLYQQMGVVLSSA